MKRLFSVLLLVFVLAPGCAILQRKDAIVWDQRTPGGMRVASHGQNVDLPALDRALDAAVDCWQVRLQRQFEGPAPDVMIMVPEGDPARKCRYYTAIEGGTFAGQYDIRQRLVMLVPDLCAAPHEMSHHVRMIMLGAPGENGDGECFF